MSALAAAPWIAQSDPVVVVGAGLAGLRAAGVLRKAGPRVVVLEARGTPGGRVQTIRAPFDEGSYGEAGPVRIPGMHQNVLQLVKDYRLNLVPFGSANGSALVTVGGVTARSPEALKEAAAALALSAEEQGLSQGALLQRYLGEFPAGLDDPGSSADSYAKWQSYDRVTWPEWLRSRGASPGAIRLMTLGGDSRELSALYVLRQVALLRNTTQFYKIQGGMDLLPRAMAKSLGSIVRYRAAVVRLDQSNGTVRVDYVENGRMSTIRASHVVLTVPFSTLRQIEVRPAFSSPKTRAIADLPYFPATRVLLQSRDRFWEDAGLSGSARTDQPAEIWDCAHDLPGTRGMLAATLGGALGNTFGTMSRGEAIKAGADLVTGTFPAMRTSFEKGSVYRWALDPWSRGAFAVFHPGQMTSMMPDIARPEGRIHFAGEHTSSWMGWMEGALESGERAAREVLA